jgi:hypothetical protein
MRKTLGLGLMAALAITATAWATFSYRTAGEPTAAMDIAAIHRATDTAALPMAPVADYTP